MALLTAAQIATITGMTEADIPADVVTWAETRVEKLLDKKYTETEETWEHILYTSQTYLQLPHQNIVSVSSFTIEDINETGLSEADDEFTVFKEEGIIRCTQLVTLKKITITYRYGNSTVEDLDKYLHLLLVIKMLILSNPDLIPKDEIEERIGDYTVKYNMTELKAKPALIDDEIKKVISDGDEKDLFYL